MVVHQNNVCCVNYLSVFITSACSARGKIKNQEEEELASAACDRAAIRFVDDV